MSTRRFASLDGLRLLCSNACRKKARRFRMHSSDAPSLTIEKGELFDQALEAAPNCPAVFVVFPEQGEPYLGKTTALRRRLLRLLKQREKPSRLLNLRQSVARVECWFTGSALESLLRHYELARTYFPRTYLDLLRL